MIITTDSPIYQKAFEQYLRRGTPIEISLKAMTARTETTASHSTTLYIWRTAGDDKVRASHAANNGKIFRWDSPPPTGNPGDAINCRCTAEPYVSPFLPNDPTINDPPLEDVYPEALLIPLLKIPRLIIAWRLWILQRNLSKTWKLGKHKSAQKWANRMEKGNWTPDKISETIRNGEAHNAPNNVNRPNTATRYELGNDFVVVDDVTKEVLQVSEPGYLPKEL